ncbi:MAG: protein kinase [Polyangiaceae bacterium]
MRAFETGELISGKYRLRRPLAKGGMGAVWTAFNEQLETPVAIKFMAAETLGSAELVERFEREAKAAAQLRVPQVVQIFEHGVHTGVPFMVMELLEGEDLSKRLRDRGRLSPSETARILGEVCKALRRAHELGIIHRDLKPANVFLSRMGDEEVVKVLDFGIAKILSATPGAHVTRTDAIIGTPNYMSPEQARRAQRQIDHRSDLWSVGVIAFRALTGKLPFAGGEMVDVIIRVISQPPPLASSMAPDLPAGTDAFFARALARDPEQRFQSAREMAEALHALASPSQGAALGQSWIDGPPPARGPVISWAQKAPVESSPSAPPPVAPAVARGGAGAMTSRRSVEPSRGAVAEPATGAHETNDSLDGAVTRPLQRPITAQPPVSSDRPSGVEPHGMPGASASPSRAASGVPPVASAAPQNPWTRAETGRKFIRTLPLEMSAAEVLASAKLHAESSAVSAASAVSVPSAASAPSAPSAASALSAAGPASSPETSEGTITSATGEMPARRSRGTSVVVWGAVAAAVLVILVVGSVVVTTVMSATEPQPEPTIPLPQTATPQLTPDPPTGTGSAPHGTLVPGMTAPVGSDSSTSATGSDTASAGPSPTASASASASASGGPAASASGAAPKAPAGGAGRRPAQGASTGDSAIFGDPVFTK